MHALMKLEFSPFFGKIYVGQGKSNGVANPSTTRLLFNFRLQKMVQVEVEIPIITVKKNKD